MQHPRSNIAAGKSGPLVLAGPIRYKPQISINSFTNTVRIDPFLGFGIVAEIGMMDLFEDHRFNGGVYFLTDFRTTHFYGEYQYLKKRFDLRIGYEKKGILTADERLLYRLNLHEATATFSYPLSYSTSIRAIPRLAATRFTPINTITLPDATTEFAGMGGEIVFDNTLPIGINMIEGIRAKAGVVDYRGIGQKGENFNKLYLDIRHYQKLHRQIIWANRMSYGHSFGLAAKRYLIGGMNNWFGSSTETPLPVNFFEHPGELFFTEFATPLRGFSYIARMGHKVILFNSELRVPI
ncbi:MAG: hypothetical protein EOP49_47985, partial [Sphingobacteriales bacterium]